ncbi:MAG: LysM peptidoglycan-binding domain-containing protein [bacterium]
MKLDNFIKSAALTILLLCYFVSFTIAQEEEKGLQMIRVVPGDTLHGVADLYLKDPTRWPELLKYNVLNSGNPDLIRPGDKLLVPVKEIKKSMRAAHLIKKINRVDFRVRGETVFRDAVEEQKIFYEDAIRTFSESYATILFPTKEVTKISPNTLAVIKPREMEQEVGLIRGEIYFSKTKILTDSAVIEPKSDGLFKAKVYNDKSAEIEVYDGKVDVVGAGKRIELTKGFGSKIELGKVPLNPRKIKMPSVDEIARMKKEITLPATFQFKAGNIQNLGVFKPEEVDLEKEIKASGKTIKKIECIEISLDEYFSQIVLEGSPHSIQSKLIKLLDGKYYYRIKYAGQKGGYSAIQSFEINRARKGIEVIILYPPEDVNVYDEFIEVRGSSSGDLDRITIDATSAELKEDGTFSQIIYLPRGSHEIEILARDKFGNTRRYTRRVKRVSEPKGFFRKIFGG